MMSATNPFECVGVCGCMCWSVCARKTERARDREVQIISAMNPYVCVDVFVCVCVCM